MNAIETQASDKDLPILAGWANEPGDEADTWPVIYNQGLWALESQGTNNTAAMGELSGINDSNIAVGYTAPTTSVANTTARYFLTGGAPYNVPVKNLGTVTISTANGINDAGDMVGTATVLSGKNYVPESWYALCLGNCPTSGGSNTSGGYCWATLNYGTNTTAYAITGLIGDTASRLIGGSYTDNSGVTHGFLVSVKIDSGVCEAGAVQQVDEPKANNVTVIRGVNNAIDIVGYYRDSSGKKAGFVGTLSSAAARPDKTSPRSKSNR